MASREAIQLAVLFSPFLFSHLVGAWGKDDGGRTAVSYFISLHSHTPLPRADGSDKVGASQHIPSSPEATQTRGAAFG